MTAILQGLVSIVILIWFIAISMELREKHKRRMGYPRRERIHVEFVEK